MINFVIDKIDLTDYNNNNMSIYGAIDLTGLYIIFHHQYFKIVGLMIVHFERMILGLNSHA